MKKRVFVFLVLIIVMLTFTGTIAFAGEDNATSGECGTNLTWSLDDNGLLSINGSGPMTEMSTYPWYSSRDDIKKIFIENGVTKIAEDAFVDCNKLTGKLTIPSSVESIGINAFMDASFTELFIPDTVESIGNYAFFSCQGTEIKTFNDCPAYTYFTTENVGEDDPQFKYFSTLTVSSMYEDTESTYLSFVTDTFKIRTYDEINLSDMISVSSDIEDEVSISIADTSVALYSSAYKLVTGKASEGATTKITVTAGKMSDSATIEIIDEPDEVESLTLNQENISVNKCSYKKLRYTLNPDNALFERITWKSTDKDIAAVDNGVVLGKNSGKTTITAATSDGTITAQCEVTVVNEARALILPDDDKLYEMHKGDSRKLTYYIYPGDAANKGKVTFSSNSSLLTIDDAGKMTAVSADRSRNPVVTLSVGELSPEKQTIDITAPLKKLTLNKEKINGLLIGEQEQLTCTFDPEDTTDDKTITWSVEGDDCLTVDNGLITATAEGRAVVTATVESADKTAKCTVICQKEVDLTGIEINKNKDTLKYGETDTLSISYVPQGATVKEDTEWISSDSQSVKVTANENTKKATVEVLKYSAEPVTITATVGGFSKECIITTLKADPQYTPPTGLTAKCNYTLADMSLSGSGDGCFEWENEDESVGAVDESKASEDKTFKAKFIPKDSVNYNIIEGIDITVTVKHNLKEINKKKATIEEAGNYSYWKCSCGACFKDEKCETATTAAAEKIAGISSINVASAEYDGTPKTPAVTIRDTEGNELEQGADKDYTVSYSNNTDVWIESDGDESKKPTATITFNSEGDYSATAESQIIDKYFIINGKSINGSDIAVEDINDRTYTGAAIEPEVTVNCTTGEGETEETVELVKDTDYTVAYENNTNAGTAKAKITGKGIYAGTRTVEFTISPRNIETAIENEEITIAEVEDRTYTGSGIKPALTITDSTIGEGGTVLEEGSAGEGESGKDYTVEYADNENVGTATAAVTGRGNYTGKATVQFSIVPKTISEDMIAGIDDQTFSGKEIKPEVTVTYTPEGGKKITLQKDTDYTVSYSNNTDAASGEDGETAGRPAAAIEGKGNYTGTVTTNFTIRPLTLEEKDVDISIAAQTWTGSEITPVPEVTMGEGENKVTLKKGTDFDVAYSDNTEVSDGTGDNAPKATITFKGNYTSTTPMVKKFAIEAITIEESNITVESLTYNGTELEPAVTVRCNVAGEEYELQQGNAGENKDYTVAYSNNRNVPASDAEDSKKPTATVTGHGNFKGTVAKTFTIRPVTITESMVTVDSAEKIYNGSEIRPAVEVKAGEGEEAVTLEKEKDFNVKYSNNVNAGKSDNEDKDKRPAITIAGSGNYDGTVTEYFTIGQRNIEAAAGSGKITVTSIPDKTYTGLEVKPAPAVNDSEMPEGKKELTAGTDFAYSYENNIEAAADDAEKAPTVAITGKGNYTGSTSVKFSILPRDISGMLQALKNDSFTYTGDEIRPDVTVEFTPEGAETPTALEKGTDEDQKDFTVSYSNNKNVPKEDAGIGDKPTVTVTGHGNYKGTDSKTFSITPKAVADSMIAAIADQTYRKGAQVTPALTVTDSDLTAADKTLKKDTDYTAAYTNNTEIADKDAGNKPAATITGKGNYKGTASATFVITPIPVQDSWISAIPDQTYTGSPVEPALTITDADGDTLTLNTDYTVEYSNNTNAGTATATVTGKGIYGGKATKEFRIKRKGLTDVTVNIEDQVYTGAKHEPAPVVKEGQTTLAAGTDYTVSYENNVNAAEKDAANAPAAIITFIGNYESVEPVTAKFTIAQRSLKAEEITVQAIGSQTYNGSKVEPAVTVIDSKRVEGEQTLVAGKDYEVSYSNNEKAGKATATIKGKGNYDPETGTTTGYVINHLDISDEGAVTVEEITDRTYTGNAIKPEPVVKVGNTKLVKGEDYTLSYENNVDVCSKDAANPPTIIITTATDSEKYTGQLRVPFTIIKRDLSDCTVELSGSMVYTGSEIKPAVELKYNDEPVEAANYDASYSNNVTAAKAADEAAPAVTLTAESDSKNYKGSISKKFTISPKEAAGLSITGDDDQQYTGSEIKPELEVTDGDLEGEDKTLKSEKDYEIAYGDNIEVASSESAKAPYARLTFKGNYTGERTVKFSIIRRSLSTEEITVAEVADKPYTGHEIKPAPAVKLCGNELTEGTDFEYSYNDKITEVCDKSADNPPEITIKAKEGSTRFEGSRTVKFSIVKRNLEDCTINLSGSMVYTGSEVEPTVEVKNGDVVVDAGNYDVEYANNIKATREGTVNKPTVTVTARTGSEASANYTGSKTQEFTITSKETGLTIGAIDDQTYTGQEIKPEPVVRDGEKTLEKGEDYEISYGNNTDVASTGDENAPYVKVSYCGDYSGSETVKFNIVKRDLSTVKIEAISNQSYTGKGIEPAPVLKLGSMTVDPSNYTCTYDNNANVCSADGEEAPKVTVTAKGDSRNFTGTNSATFSIIKRDLKDCTVNLSGSMVYTGSEIKPTIEVKNGDVTVNADNYELTFANNVDAAACEADKAPTVTVTAVSESESYTGGISKKFTIAPKSEGMTVETIADQPYAAREIEPALTVKDGAKELKKSTDYSVTYGNNLNVAAESDENAPYATITFKGNYSGEKTVKFSIVKKNIKDCTISLSGPMVYIGLNEEVKPDVEVKNGDSVVDPENYVVDYADNKTAKDKTAEEPPTVIVTAKDPESESYTGSQSVAFTIEQCDLGKCTVEITNPTTGTDEFVYTGSPIKPEEVVVMNGENTVNPNNYSLTYGTNVDAAESTSGKAAKVIVKAKETGNYKGSMTRTFTILPKAYGEESGITIEAIPEQHYTESAIEPELTVKDTGLAAENKTLKQDTDYTVTYGNNISKGKSTDGESAPYAKVVFRGNYSGEETVKFTIGAGDMGVATLEEIPDKLYTGEAIMPEPEVTWNGRTLAEGTDFEYSYDNNIGTEGEDVTATVTVTGKGNYAGTKSQAFRIVQKVDISKAEVTMSGSSYTYSGKQIRPSARITYDGNTYSSSVSYKKNVAIGTAIAYVGGSRFNGTVTKYFTINPQSVGIKTPSKGSKKFTAKWSKVSKKKKSLVTGYQIRYSLKSSFASGVKYKSAKGWNKSSVTVKGLAKKKTYYVQVRTYKTTGGKTYYSGWSKKKSVKTR